MQPDRRGGQGASARVEASDLHRRLEPVEQHRLTACRRAGNVSGSWAEERSGCATTARLDAVVTRRRRAGARRRRRRRPGA